MRIECWQDKKDMGSGLKFPQLQISPKYTILLAQEDNPQHLPPNHPALTKAWSGTLIPLRSMRAPHAQR